MTRRRKTLLVVLALVILAAGGCAWYWQATAVDRQVHALLNEVREEEPGLVQRWLIDLRLMKARRPGRTYDEVTADLAGLGPSAVPALSRAFQDSDWMVRCAAATGLGKLGDARAVDPLVAALKDESKYVRLGAAEALGKLGDRRGVELLAELLGDEDADFREAATEALEKLRRQSEGKPFGGAQDKP